MVQKNLNVFSGNIKALIDLIVEFQHANFETANIFAQIQWQIKRKKLHNSIQLSEIL